MLTTAEFWRCSLAFLKAHSNLNSLFLITMEGKVKSQILSIMIIFFFARANGQAFLDQCTWTVLSWMLLLLLQIFFSFLFTWCATKIRRLTDFPISTVFTCVFSPRLWSRPCALRHESKFRCAQTGISFDFFLPPRRSAHFTNPQGLCCANDCLSSGDASLRLHVNWHAADFK